MLGLTGGIGAGKSTVAGMLARRGALVIDADHVAREVVEPGRPAYAAIVGRFGPGVVRDDGQIDRQALADVVFADERSRADLNEIVHPAVADAIRHRLAAMPADAVAVVEVPLLVEAGWKADVVVVVDAPEEVARDRLLEERAMSEEDVRRRMAAQAPRHERRSRADHVVANAGSLSDLEGEVEKLWSRVQTWRRCKAGSPLPWRRLVSSALAGTLLALSLVLVHLSITGRSPLNLLQAGTRGPSAAAIRRDFPDAPLPGGVGHDGQQFYAIARQPMHWHALARDLDRVPYRLQRPLLPWLAWLLHPGGGGGGLVVALLVVGLAGLFAGALAFGVVAVAFGGSPLLGLVFPLLPGALVALRITTADGLAAGLALVAIAFLVRNRPVPALVAAVAAVLAKESSVLILLGYAAWRRDRASVGAAGAALGAAAALAAVLRLTFPHAGRQVVDFTFPLLGLVRAVAHWSGGADKLALATMTATLAVAVAALVRGGLRNPFGWAVAGNLALLSVLRFDAWGLDLNATRAALPLAACSVLGLAVAQPAAPESEPGP